MLSDKGLAYVSPNLLINSHALLQALIRVNPTLFEGIPSRLTEDTICHGNVKRNAEEIGGLDRHRVRISAICDKFDIHIGKYIRADTPSPPREPFSRLPAIARS
jgi:hypothetical protein